MRLTRGCPAQHSGPGSPPTPPAIRPTHPGASIRLKAESAWAQPLRRHNAFCHGPGSAPSPGEPGSWPRLRNASSLYLNSARGHYPPEMRKRSAVPRPAGCLLFSVTEKTTLHCSVIAILTSECAAVWLGTCFPISSAFVEPTSTFQTPVGLIQT